MPLMDESYTATDKIREVLDDYLDRVDVEDIDTDVLAENIARHLGMAD